MKMIVSFKEDPETIERIDTITKDKGSNRSTFIREAIRNELSREARRKEAIHAEE